MKESVKFGTKNLVGVRNKFNLGTTGANDAEGKKKKKGFQFSTIFISMKTRLTYNSKVFNSFEQFINYVV